MTGPDYTLRPRLELAPSAYPGRNYTVSTGSRAPSLRMSREEKQQVWMDKELVGASQESDDWSIIVYAVSVVFFLVALYRHGVSEFHHRGHFFCPGVQLPVQDDAVRAAILPSDTYPRGGRGRWPQAPRLRRGGAPRPRQGGTWRWCWVGAATGKTEPGLLYASSTEYGVCGAGLAG